MRKLEPWGKFGKGWEVEKNYAAVTVPYYHAIIAIPKAWTPGTNGLIKSDVVLIKIDTHYRPGSIQRQTGWQDRDI